MYKNQPFKKMHFFQTCKGKVTSQKAVPLAAFLAIFISIAANGQHELVVEVSNIKNQEGNVAVALYNTENGFMKSPFQGKSLKAAKGSVEFVFQDVPAGTYAVSVMHDANENGKLDYRTSGIPKEGFGFSNNALSKLGIPKFEKAKFEFTTKTKIQIALRYIEPHHKKESEP
jgi:uncharacterized protein (DUF2141 family)